MEKVTRDLVYLDTETTGVLEEDRIIQVAYNNGKELVNELFKPELPIKIDSMAVCHITNKMVEDNPKFKGSETQSKLIDIFASNSTVLDAHNAKFDIEMLRREGVVVMNHVCTEKIAKHLDPDVVIPKYNLQYLRYLLDLETDGATAHDAGGDVLVLEKLFERLFDKMFDNKDKDIPFATGDDALDEMVNISSNPVLIKKFTFGKYIRLNVADIAEKDRGYLEWLKGEKEKDDMPDEDWLYTLRCLNI